jgi:hypothetical protein
MPLAAGAVPSPFAAGKASGSPIAGGPLDAFAAALSCRGIDVVEPFALGW